MGYPIYKKPFPAVPVSGGSSGKGSSIGGSGSYGYKGAFNDRQRRADYNAWRRGGDCFALDIPNIVLWMDEELLLEDEILY